MGRFTQLMPNPAHELVSVIYELNGRQMLEQETHAIATKKLLVEWQFCHLPKRIPCEKKLMNKKKCVSLQIKPLLLKGYVLELTYI